MNFRNKNDINLKPMNRNRRQIRLSESQFHSLIEKGVRKVLNEIKMDDPHGRGFGFEGD